MLLACAAIVGTISPAGKDIGAFLSIEQAILPQTTTDRQRTSAFAAYIWSARSPRRLARSPRACRAGRASADSLVRLQLGVYTASACCSSSCSRVFRIGWRPSRPGDRDRCVLGMHDRRRGGAALGAVRVRLVRQRIHDPEPGSLLVQRALRRGHRDAWQASSSARTCWPLSRSWRRRHSRDGSACQDDGLHQPALEHPADARPIHADSGASDLRVPCAQPAIQLDIPTRQSYVVAIVELTSDRPPPVSRPWCVTPPRRSTDLRRATLRQSGARPAIHPSGAASKQSTILPSWPPSAISALRGAGWGHAAVDSGQRTESRVAGC